jgi:hypothetical protein
MTTMKRKWINKIETGGENGGEEVTVDVTTCPTYRRLK